MSERAGDPAQQADFHLRYNQCWVFPWGLSWLAGNERVSARWGDVTTLRQGRRRLDMSTSPMGYAPTGWTGRAGAWYSYTVVLANGQSGTFVGYHSSFEGKLCLEPTPGKIRNLNICQWGDLVERRVTSAQLPKALDALSVGQTIQFGPLAVTPAGISDGNKVLPWSQVKNARVRASFVVVMWRRGVPWQLMHVSKVPNYCVFVALVGAVLADPGR